MLKAQLQEMTRNIMQGYADQGMSLGEAAHEIGISKSYLCGLAKRNGIKFRDTRGGGNGAKASRNAEIVAAFEAGEALEAIGQRHSITRERVRQIVERAGCVSRREESAKLTEAIAEIAKDGATLKEVAEASGMLKRTAYERLRRAGITPVRDTRARRESERLATALARIAAGASIRQACDEDHSFENVVQRYLKQNSEFKPKYGRWRDFGQRHEIVKRMIGEGASFYAIAKAVSEVEGKTVEPASLYGWAYKCGYIDKKPPKPRVIKVKPERPPVTLNGYSSVKEACLALKGKHTAAEIAAALGVTRNSVIGHWHRSKVQS